ncbi:MAG: glutathione S-transferase [Gammaproteobacteria bacterium]|jgi:glutathione S-transferase|nr:glutathione S-transferase [Gammaproteobacteria bacterium]MBT4493598.1 glutathione S-transferase [Gammaproteobacteria bacterium]MBT7369905.1 glutathione S-transferase [Gammaproteobacteria bacterium]
MQHAPSGVTMTDSCLPVQGSPGSPYTRKMLAVLRYRRIPYRFLQSENDDLPKPKVGLIPIFYFADDHGELQAEVDSTPIIRRLEEEYPGRSVIPADPAIAFINNLLEDYGDEWLTKAMFHYRWHYQDDIEMAGSVLPHYQDVTQSDGTIAAMKKMFSERQISRLYVVGSNDTTASVIEDSYKRFLHCLNNHLKELPFLMGTRPASADFACFGQLTQLTQFDPTPAKIAAASYPRVHAWVSKMEDHSGLDPAEDGFVSTTGFPSTLRTILKEVGRTYVPVMLANAAAIDQGLDEVTTEVDGKPWAQEPFPYQAKCLQWIRIEYARLDDDDKNRVDEILKDTNCEQLFIK